MQANKILTAFRNSPELKFFTGIFAWMLMPLLHLSGQTCHLRDVYFFALEWKGFRFLLGFDAYKPFITLD